MAGTTDPKAAVLSAVRSFDAAAADFTRLSPYLWDRVGRATVDASKPQPGEWVLDACCGDGASAIPAARLVGAEGHVDAVDLSAPLVEAVVRAGSALPQLTAHRADAAAWVGPSLRTGVGYDVVQCVLGIFFFPDMTTGTEYLVSRLRPGGRAALTIWRRGSMAEVGKRLAAAAAQVRGQLPPTAREPHLVERIGTITGYAQWLAERGLREVEVHEYGLVLELTPELAWLLVIGSGFRGILTGLDAQQIAAVRNGYLAALELDGLTEVDATTLVGTGLR